MRRTGTATASLLAAMTLPHTFRTGIERTFTCSDGLKLAAKYWKHSTSTTGSTISTSQNVASTSTSNKINNRRILCLHGWLDNCASFHLLAPSLVNGDGQCGPSAVEVLALDFPGHGLSSHKSADGPTSLLSEYCFYVNEAINQMEWDKYTLVGHSMGAGISVIMAAAFPERIESLVLLEGVGPLCRDPNDSAKHVRQSIEKRMISNKTLYKDGFHSPRRGRIYSDKTMAVKTRMQTAKLSPGNQYLSREAAEIMVERALVRADGTKESLSTSVSFRHDPRLMWPSLQYTTQEQLNAFWDNIICPTMLVEAQDGWPISSSLRDAAEAKLKLRTRTTLPGSHHNHADPETATEVIDEVKRFLHGL